MSVEELRAWVSDEALNAAAALDGVVLKTWFYNEVENLWGGIYLVQDLDVFQQLPRDASGATGPLGSSPPHIIWGHLEAATVGPKGVDALLEVVGEQGRRVFEPQPLPPWSGGYSRDSPPTGFQNRR